MLGDEFLIEDLQPRSGLKLMGARRRFAFSGRANGLYLYSERNQVRRIDEDRGVPYFRIPLPTNALFQQRRRSTRYEVPGFERTPTRQASISTAAYRPIEITPLLWQAECSTSLLVAAG